MGTELRPAAVLAQQDLVAERQEYLIPIPRSLQCHALKAIDDPQDLPALFLILNILILVVPLAAYLHLVPSPPHGLGVLYMVFNYVIFLQRFLLTLHYTEHRRLFRSGRPTSYPFLLTAFRSSS